MVVLDCSVTMPWVFTDEVTKYTETLLDYLGRGNTGLVPALWALEVSNVLLTGEKRKRITEAQSAGFWQTLKSLRIELDSETASRATDATLHLARRHDLSIYDAAYLELALRKGAPIATLDKSLLRAASRASVEVWQA